MSLGNKFDISTIYNPNTYTNVTLVWYDTLPGVISSGLTFNGFKLGIPNIYLSFKAELLDVNTTGAVFNLYVDSGATVVKYISCSIMVVTSNSYEIELVSTQHNSTDATATIEYATVTPSKFNLAVDSPWYKVMPQWLTGTVNVITAYRFEIRYATVLGTGLQVELKSDAAKYFK